NALVPVVTVVGLQAGALLGGAIITETIFALPGVGRLLVDAIFQRDFPIVQGVVLFLALNFLVVNLLVHLPYPFPDPPIPYDRWPSTAAPPRSRPPRRRPVAGRCWSAGSCAATWRSSGSWSSPRSWWPRRWRRGSPPTIRPSRPWSGCSSGQDPPTSSAPTTS